MEAAIEQCAESYDVSVQWRPFLLRPDNPKEGVPKQPDTPENPRVGTRMKEIGQSVGIDFTGKCDRIPNSVLAHCLLYHVLQTKGAAMQDRLCEILFRAYFTDGLYPDVDNLATLAAEVGLDEEEVRRVLKSGKHEEQVVREANSYSSSGISGVPLFIINGKPAFSGAQDASSFVRAFEMVGGEEESSQDT